MSRPPTIPAEKKLRIVLSVLQGEITIAEAARREKVSEQAIGNWKRQFLEGGKAGIEAGKSKPSTREQQLEDEVLCSPARRHPPAQRPRLAGNVRPSPLSEALEF